MNYVVMKTSDDMRDAFVSACQKSEEAVDIMMNDIKENIREGYPQAYVVFNLRTGLSQSYEPSVSIDLKEV